MSAPGYEQLVEKLLTYWVPKLTQSVPEGHDLYPETYPSGSGKVEPKNKVLDPRQRIHPSVYALTPHSSMSRMEEVMRGALFAIANGYNISVTWERKE